MPEVIVFVLFKHLAILFTGPPYLEAISHLDI